MPVALFAALLGSLAIHAVAVLGLEGEPFGSEPEAPPLRAELKPLPAAPVPEAPLASEKAPAKPQPRVVHAKAAPVSAAPPSPAPAEPAETSEIAPETPSTVTRPPAPPATPVLPATGTIRFAIFKVPLGLQVGRAEHSWEFTGDGPTAGLPPRPHQLTATR